MQAAALVPARVIKMDATLGSVEAGKSADLLIGDGNPLDDILLLRRVATTNKGGVFYDSRALYASAGVTATSTTKS